MNTTFIAGTTGDDLFVNAWDGVAFSGPGIPVDPREDRATGCRLCRHDGGWRGGLVSRATRRIVSGLASYRASRLRWSGSFRRLRSLHSPGRRAAHVAASSRQREHHPHYIGLTSGIAEVVPVEPESVAADRLHRDVDRLVERMIGTSCMQSAMKSFTLLSYSAGSSVKRARSIAGPSPRSCRRRC